MTMRSALLDRVLVLEMVRVTEAAAIAAKPKRLAKAKGVIDRVS